MTMIADFVFLSILFVQYKFEMITILRIIRLTSETLWFLTNELPAVR